MNESRIRITVAASMLVMLAGSSVVPASAADAPAAVGACDLLTQAQVSSAFGLRVDPGTRPVEADPSLCNWREAGKPTGPGRNVMLTIIDASSFDAARTRRSGAAQPAHADLGDDAFFRKLGRFPVNLFLKKGTQYFRIMARTQVTAAGGTETADEADKAVEEKIAVALLKNR